MVIGPQPIAAFDVDGTIIEGQTQAMLVRRLSREGILPADVLGSALIWFIGYGLGFPVKQEAIRVRVLSQLAGMTREAVNQLADSLHDVQIAGRIRPRAAQEVRRLESDGVRTVLLSAAAEPIVARVASAVGATGYIGTRLEEEGGALTGRIQGAIVDGPAKVDALKSWADERYERWALVAAYGDSPSDIAMMDAAAAAYAVCPSAKLKAAALGRGWPILDWSSAAQSGLRD